MLMHDIRSAITAGNKVIHNFFSVDMAVFVYGKQCMSCRSLISNRQSWIRRLIVLKLRSLVAVDTGRVPKIVSNM